MRLGNFVEELCQRTLFKITLLVDLIRRANSVDSWS